MQALILRVLVVDDSEIVRRGICQILQSQTDIEVVGEAADGADAVRKVRQHRPHVVLLDITMPVMNCFEAARLIKHESPSTLILVVSQFESAPFAREAIAAGASAYVEKSNASTELIPMLRKTMSEQAKMTPKVLCAYCVPTEICASRSEMDGSAFHPYKNDLFTMTRSDGRSINPVMRLPAGCL